MKSSWMMEGYECANCGFPVVVACGDEADYYYYCSNFACECHAHKECSFASNYRPVWVTKQGALETQLVDVAGETVSVDGELGLLLQALNSVGLKTTKSCSGHGEEPAWVVIATDSIRNVEFRAAGTRGPHQELKITWNLQEAQ